MTASRESGWFGDRQNSTQFALLDFAAMSTDASFRSYCRTINGLTSVLLLR